jgi:hypothetical protein
MCVTLLLAGMLTSTGRAAPVPFSIRIAPADFQVAIPGQRIVALVRIRNARPVDAPVILRASATDAWVRPNPIAVSGGRVAYIPIVPRAEGTVHVRVVGTRQGLTVRRSLRIEVWEGQDGLAGHATELRDRFVAWLAAERPELGIDDTTRWHPTIVWPYVLEVSHYLFFTRDWEMGLSWHIMIPPYDWTSAYLRPRDAMRPAVAFQIDSVSDTGAVPHPIDPPAEVMR